MTGEHLGCDIAMDNMRREIERLQEELANVKTPTDAWRTRALRAEVSLAAIRDHRDALIMLNKRLEKKLIRKHKHSQAQVKGKPHDLLPG